jgi:hypothetical protein
MNGLGFDVGEVLDGPVPGGTRVDVDRSRQDVGDNVMVSVVMPGSQPTGGSPRCTATANPSRSMAEREVGDLRLRYMHDAHGRLLSSSCVQASSAGLGISESVRLTKSSCGKQIAGVAPVEGDGHAYVTTSCHWASFRSEE